MTRCCSSRSSWMEAICSRPLRESKSRGRCGACELSCECCRVAACAPPALCPVTACLVRASAISCLPAPYTQARAPAAPSCCITARPFIARAFAACTIAALHHVPLLCRLERPSHAAWSQVQALSAAWGTVQGQEHCHRRAEGTSLPPFEAHRELPCSHARTPKASQPLDCTHAHCKLRAQMESLVASLASRTDPIVRQSQFRCKFCL